MNKILNIVARSHNIAMFAVILPFVYGCNGGGGGISASVGGLFGGKTASIASLTTDVSSGSGGLATLHNPEPATMVLLGSGMLMMGYLRSRKNLVKK